MAVSYTTIQKFRVSKFFVVVVFFRKFILLFSKDALIKSGSKGIYSFTEDLYFK